MNIYEVNGIDLINLITDFLVVVRCKQKSVDFLRRLTYNKLVR